jgi:hypothetical protein
VQLIWREEIKPLICVNVNVDTPEPTLFPEPELLPVIEAQSEETVLEKETVSAPTVTHDIPKTSALHDLIGKGNATVLLQNFPGLKSRTFMKQIKNEANDKSKLNYLAKRCVMPDYPDELRKAETWSLQLLYPHLPKKLFSELMPKGQTLTAVQNYHTALVETEQQFVLTPECGMTDPPMVAFYEARKIFNRVMNKKKGITVTVDPAAIYRGPTYANDDGKPPIFVCGTQLWPAEEGTGYNYDDLRCAYGLADDVLNVFGQPRDVPMTTKSLKLRHLMAWLPGGYNSTGTSSIDGILKALKRVVQAYSSNKDEKMMRAPLPSMKKLDE